MRASTFVTGATLLAVLAVVSPARAEGDHLKGTTTWKVEGVHNHLGKYTGSATMTLDEKLRGTITVSCTLSESKKSFTWTGKGSDDMNDLNFTIDLNETGMAHALEGAPAVKREGSAAYVIAPDGRSFKGSWDLEKVGSHDAGSIGGSETFTLVDGSPLVTTDAKLPAPKIPPTALAVPIVTQPNGWSCGPSSLQGCLYYYRVDDGSVEDLYKLVHATAKNGTEPQNLAAQANKTGLKAKFKVGTTLAELHASLKARNPVIIDLQAWRYNPSVSWSSDDNGHYVVLIGLDENYAYFMDPSAHMGYAYIPLKEFEARWHDTFDSGKRFEHGAIFLQGQAPAQKPWDFTLIRMQ
jgi:predicted double-glycine peptidase